MAEASNLYQTRASHYEDEGEGEVDNDVVGEEWNGNDQRQADAAFAIDVRKGGNRMNESEDGQDAKAEENDGDAQQVDRVAESWELGGHQLVGALNQEEVQEDLAAHVEDQTDIDSSAAAAFGGEVPRVDEKTGGEDEGKRAGVDG